jgi:hypothetical protein
MAARSRGILGTLSAWSTCAVRHPKASSKVSAGTPGDSAWASLQIEGFVCGVILIATPTLGSLIGTAKGGRVEEDNRACVE